MSDNDDKSAQDSLADKTGQTGGAAVASGTAAYTTGPANSYGSADPRIPDKASPSDISNGKTIDDTPNTSQQAGLVAADDARSGGTPRNDFAFMSDPNLSGAQKAAAFEDHVNVDDGHGNTVHTIGQMTGFFLDAPNEITGAACGDGNNAIVGNFHYVEKVDLGGGNFEYRNEGSNDTVTFNADGSYSFGNGGASDYAGFYNNGKPEFRQDASGYTRWDRNGNWQNVAGDKDCHQTWGFADGSKATFTKDGKVVVHTADGKDVTYQTQGTLGLGNVTHVGSDGSLSLDNKALGADTQGNPETRNTVLHPDGSSESHWSDGSWSRWNADGSGESEFRNTDGGWTKTTVDADGTKRIYDKSAGSGVDGFNVDVPRPSYSLTEVDYKNGNVDRFDKDGTHTLYDKAAGTWTTTNPHDGTTTTRWTNGDTETRNQNGQVISENKVNGSYTSQAPNGDITHYNGATGETTVTAKDGTLIHDQKFESDHGNYTWTTTDKAKDGTTTTTVKTYDGTTHAETVTVNGKVVSETKPGPNGTTVETNYQTGTVTTYKTVDDGYDGTSGNITSHQEVVSAGHFVTVPHVQGSEIVAMVDANSRLLDKATFVNADARTGTNDSQVTSAVERNLDTTGLQLAESRAVGAMNPTASSSPVVATQMLSAHDTVAAAMVDPQPLVPKVSETEVATHVNLVEAPSTKAADLAEAVKFDPHQVGDKVALNPQPLPPKALEVNVAKVDLASHGDKVALNPQPLPPKAVVAHTPLLERYDDNMIARGDSKFHQDTGESTHTAAATYAQAAGSLGPRPQQIQAGANESPTSPNVPNIHLTPAEVNAGDHLDKVALNPQPLPPKALEVNVVKGDWASHSDKVASNPQPLPPKAFEVHVARAEEHVSESHYPVGLGPVNKESHDAHLTVTSHEAGVMAHDFNHHNLGHHSG